MIKLAVDAMGGDFAPIEIVKGVNLAIKKHEDLEINLYGDENEINKYLEKNERVTVIHTPYKLDMGEENPVMAIRSNKELSLVKTFKAVHDKECAGAVTCGPTQCVVVGAHMVVKKLPGMQRVALAPSLPKINGKSRMMVDVGANVELRPEHIEQIALFAKTFLQKVKGIENPSVGLINIGVEPHKGREQDRETYELLSKNPEINFYGNVEPTSILSTECDVLVTDGFSGNLVMKTVEGTAKAVGGLLKENIKSSLGGKIGYLFMRKNMKNFKNTLSGDEVGGALLFGVDGVIVKAHGSSSAIAVNRAIELCMDGVKGGYVDIMRQYLESVEVKAEN